MEVKDLKQDKRNYRKHNNENLRLIKKSIKEVGLGRSIVIDAENEIVCGNGLVSQLDRSTPVKVIETDGTELVVVKRVDLKTKDKKRRKLAVLDNTTSDTSEQNLALMKEDFEIPELLDLGVKIKVKDEEDEPEVEFTEELMEEHNFVVLYFDNSVDWLQAQTVFGDLLKNKQSLGSHKGYRKIGIGRVIRGAEFLKKITEGN